MTFTICDLHVLMRIHAWNRAKLAREIQNFGGKQSVQMASAKKAGKLLFIVTGSSLYLFKRALHLGGSDIVRRHARPAARLARRLEGEDLFAGYYTLVDQNLSLKKALDRGNQNNILFTTEVTTLHHIYSLFPRLQSKYSKFGQVLMCR